MNRLTWIEGEHGLQTSYGGGDYTASVWLDPFTGDYDLIYCRSDSFISHQSETVHPEDLEAKLRSIQPDLRRWKQVTFEG